MYELDVSSMYRRAACMLHAVVQFARTWILKRLNREAIFITRRRPKSAAVCPVLNVSKRTPRLPPRLSFSVQKTYCTVQLYCRPHSTSCRRTRPRPNELQAAFQHVSCPVTRGINAESYCKYPTAFCWIFPWLLDQVDEQAHANFTFEPNGPCLSHFTAVFFPSSGEVGFFPVFSFFFFFFCQY